LLNYKFRLYPTREQEPVLEQTLDGCRCVYNYFLDKNMSEYDMNYALTELKEQHSWLRNYLSKMLQIVGKQVAAAKKTTKEKRLSYRKDDDFNAFTYRQSGFRLGNNKLLLSKIGRMKIVLHRRPFNVKQVTISRTKTGKWYAVAACGVLHRLLHLTIAYS
jgi:putative transposase